MKFSLVLILSLALFSFVNAQVPEEWTVVIWNPDNTALVGILNDGLQDALPEAIAAGQLGAGRWSLAKVNSITEQAEGNGGDDYLFNIEITNGQNSTRFSMLIENDGEENQLLRWEVL